MKSRILQNLVISTWLAGIVLLSAGRSQIWAQDNSFPLPAALTDPDLWDQADFMAVWRPARSPSAIAHKTWPNAPVIFGRRPHYISGHFINGRLESITLLFLDSGTHFVYVSRDKALATEKMKRKPFTFRH